MIWKSSHFVGAFFIKIVKKFF